MLSENLYNRICQLFFNEDVRLSNNLVEIENYIFHYRPIEPEPYIKLVQAQTEKAYFDKYIFSILRWLDSFVESG